MSKSICGFLKSMAEIEESTAYLYKNGLASNDKCRCKDWDISRIIDKIKDGNILDMGSFGSLVLKNVLLKGLKGEKYGIDLSPQPELTGVKYIVGDLMFVPIRDGFFDYITCLSVIEHEVDFGKFAKEASRLLAPGGSLFVTFDYWDPKVPATVKMFGLKWQPLDWAMVEELIAECSKVGLTVDGEIDRSLGDPVIKEGYHSPQLGIRYTFGLLVFKKVING
jgi:SAM-dependent methyltransferase